MAEDLKKEAFFDRLKALCPTVDNLRLMLGAARHAFNRHSLAKLGEIDRLQDDITFDLDPFFEEVEAALKKSSGADRPYLTKFQEILSHLELMADKIAGLADPIPLPRLKKTCDLNSFNKHVTKFMLTAGWLWFIYS